MDAALVSPSNIAWQPAMPSACQTCSAERFCRPVGQTEPSSMFPVNRSRKVIHRGESVYRTGDALQNFFLLRSGSVKMRVTNSSGLEQITAFPVAGAMLGLDGIETGHHTCDAIALEDSLVCVLPFADLMRNCRDDFGAAQHFNRLIAHDTNQYCRLLLTLGCMSAEERVAGFLIGISEQMSASGYSPMAFTLKMTREDIANHLGMKVETVCRVFSRLQEAALVQVRKRQLEIRNVDALRKMSCG